MSYVYASTLYPTSQARMNALVEDFLTACGTEPAEYATELARNGDRGELIEEMIDSEWITPDEETEARFALAVIAAR